MGSKRDSLKQYLDEIGRVPRLTAAQEIELARRIEQGDKEAKGRLAAANLRLVISVAQNEKTKRHIEGMDFLDVIQHGNVGLMKAVERFDWRRGYRFSTYATWWIRQAVIRGIQNEGRTIRTPVNWLRSAHKLMIIGDVVQARTGRAPTIKEIAKETRWPEDKVTEALIRVPQIQGTHSLDASRPEKEGAPEELFADPHSVDPSQEALKVVFEEEVRTAIERYLTSREQAILAWRFGLNGYGPVTIEEVAKKLGISYSLVRKINQIAFTKLRPHLSHLSASQLQCYQK